MVARSLGRLGPAVKAASSDLLALLSDEEDDVRDAAIQALKRIDPEAAAKAKLP